MGRKFLTIFFSFFLLSSTTVLAVNSPSFGSCPNPGGENIANYSDGQHAIINETNLRSGTDSVYQTELGATQCFCSGNTGIQTNFWKINDFSIEDISTYESQGWTYIPDGSVWGLTSGPYLAKNIYGTCSTSSNENNNSNGTGGGNPSAPSCNDQTPSSAPILLSVSAIGDNKVKLTWSAASDPVSYYLVAYGTEPGKYLYGNPNVGDKNTREYVVENLSGQKIYYFAVRAGNGCKPGPFSNELTQLPTGGIISDVASGFIPGVLGKGDNLGQALATQSGEIIGVSNAFASCGSCFWWPILLGEFVLLGLYHVYFKNNPFTKRRLVFGFLAAVVAYIIFLLFNRSCPDGVIDLKIFTIPCKLFWAIDGTVFALVSAIGKLFFSTADK